MSNSDQPPRPHDEEDRERRVLASAWKGARHILDHMLGLLDPPAVIARERVARSPVRHMLSDWIRNLEIYVRRLLFITALTLSLPPPRSSGGKKALPQPHAINIDDPSSWKVSLRFCRHPPETLERRTRQNACADVRYEWDTMPFALRLEALCRIIAQPERRARSVARTLARIRAANVGRNKPRIFAIRQWLIHSSVCTPAQESIADLMDGTEPLAERMLVRWQEPG